MFCEKCGKKIEENSHFCIYCGGDINGDGVSTPLSYEELKNDTSKSNSGIKVFLWIVGVFMIVSGLALIGYYNTNLANTQSKKSKEQTQIKEIDNTRTVVQILCDKSAGSGTMMTEEGLILTNYHVVEDEEFI